MSIVREYRSLEEQIKELQQRKEQLEQSQDLKKEFQFETELRDLLARNNKSLRDIIAILDPQSLNKAPRASNKEEGKRSRKVKQYKNPHTGEVIETKGGNHKVLKAWKAQWGGDVVEGWMTLLG